MQEHKRMQARLSKPPVKKVTPVKPKPAPSPQITSQQESKDDKAKSETPMEGVEGGEIKVKEEVQEEGEEGVDHSKMPDHPGAGGSSDEEEEEEETKKPEEEEKEKPDVKMEEEQ